MNKNLLSYLLFFWGGGRARVGWGGNVGIRKYKAFVRDPGERRYEPGALMKRVEQPTNTLKGPWWLLGNKAKWLLSESARLSAAASHLRL